jgi:co-chaperonin GroES (HSP10)
VKVRMQNDWIHVQPDSEVEEVVGGVILPAGSVYRRATVLSAGPGKEYPNGVRDPIGVSPGDRVMYLKLHEYHANGNLLRATLGDGTMLVQQRDVLAVLEEE